MRMEKDYHSAPRGLVALDGIGLHLIPRSGVRILL